LLAARAFADGVGFFQGLDNVVGGETANVVNLDVIVIVGAHQMQPELLAAAALGAFQDHPGSLLTDAKSLHEHGFDRGDIGAGFEDRGFRVWLQGQEAGRRRMGQTFHGIRGRPDQSLRIPNERVWYCQLRPI